MNCPHCKKEIPDELFAKHFAAKGGKSAAKKMTKDERKARASTAAKAKWAKRKKQK